MNTITQFTIGAQCLSECGAALSDGYLAAIDRAGLRRLELDGFTPVQCPLCNSEAAQADPKASYPLEIVLSHCWGCTIPLPDGVAMDMKIYCTAAINGFKPCSSDGLAPDLLNAEIAANKERDAIEAAKRIPEERRARLVSLARERARKAAQSVKTAEQVATQPFQESYLDPLNPQSRTAAADAFRFIQHRPAELLLEVGTDITGRAHKPYALDGNGYWRQADGVLMKWMQAANEKWLQSALGDTKTIADAARRGEVMRDATLWVARGDERKGRYAEMVNFLGQVVSQMRDADILPESLTICNLGQLGLDKSALPARTARLT